MSHLGVLSLENLQAAAYRPQPALVSLDNTTPALAAALHDLDSMPTRNTENVYVLYVRTGQSKLTDIFRNKVNVSPMNTYCCLLIFVCRALFVRHHSMSFYCLLVGLLIFCRTLDGKGHSHLLDLNSAN